jgi:hypothetical protein
LAGASGIAASRDGARDNGIDSILVAQSHQSRNGRQVAIVGIVIGIASCIAASGIVAAAIASVCVGIGIAVTIRAAVCIAICVFLFFFLFFTEFFVSGNGDTACARGPVQKSGWSRIGIFHQPNVKIRISAQLQQSEFVFDLCAPTEHTGHQASGRNLPEVIRAANTDGRKRCFDSVGFLVGVADRPCNGAKAALNKAHGGTVFLAGSRLEAVVTDLENGICLQGNDGVVSQTQLRIPVGAGCNGVTHEKIHTACQRSRRSVRRGSDLARYLDYFAYYGFFRRVTDKRAKPQA